MTTALRWIALGALFLIPFLPIYVDASLFFPFISSKGFAFRILVEIALAAWLLLALSDKRYRPKFSWTLLIYAAFIAWMLLADVLAVNPDKALWSNFERMEGWVLLIHVFSFFVVAGSMLSVEKLWKPWWYTVLGVSALVIGHGFIQMLCAGAECAATFPIHQGGVRVDANLGNAAYLAAYLLFTIAIALWQAIAAKGWLRYLFIALAALQVIVLFSTATRGAILGLVGAAGLAIVLWIVESGKTGRKAGIVALVALLVIIGGFFLVKDTSFVREDPVLTRIASISLEDGSVRFTLWDMAMKGFAERPITGWGQEGFIHVFTKHYDPALYDKEPWFDRAHSVYFDWLISGGAPALLLFLALLVSAVVALYRSSVPRAERVLIIAALAAYAFQALFVFDNLMTYVLLAAILALAHDASDRQFKKLQALPELPQSQRATIALPVVLVLLGAALFVVNVNNIMAGKDLIRAVTQTEASASLAYFKEILARDSFAEQEIREQLVSIAARIASRNDVAVETKQEFVTLAFTEMEAHLKRVPSDVRVMLQYAQGLQSVGEYDSALAVIAKAEALSPKKQTILLQKGLVLVEKGDLQNALTTFTKAYELAPANSEAVMYVAVTQVLSGQYAEADATLLKQFGTTTIDHPALRYAYFTMKRYDDLLASATLHAQSAPNDPSALLQLAQALAFTGRFNDARVLTEEIIKQFPSQAPAAAEFLKQLQNAPQ